MRKTIVRRLAPDTADHFPNVSPLMRRVYAARGVRDEGELEYQLTRLLRPELKGLSAAVELLADALTLNQRILIVGDFDADGATSTVLAIRCLKAFGCEQVDYLVPNRFEYGYGLTPEIVAVAAKREPHLIVTVDNGISSVAGVAAAKQCGIRVLVTDHHLPGNELPDADAIVNPNQPGCEFISKSAAGVGVVFYVMSALRTHLREKHWFHAQRPEPNLANFLDIVALGTVADVVPLDFNNRILVAQGLKRMRAGQACPGIQAILAVAGRNHQNISAVELGFVVGPRLNAAGRLDDMSLGIQCLLSDEDSTAKALAQELDDLNRERRSIEASMQREALDILNQMQNQTEQQLPSGLCFYQDDWHQGVIGILASRMKDRTHRPVIVFADADSGQLKGSGRSIAGVHLRDVLDCIAKEHPLMLSKFGGHAMAAGLSLAKVDLPNFCRAFEQVVTRYLGEQGLHATVATDGPLLPQEFQLALAEQLQNSGPWGQGFPEPCFDGEFVLLQQKLVGDKHLKMVLAIPGSEQAVMDAIAFNVDLEQWPNSHCLKVRVAYKLAVNEYRGRRSLQLLVDYFEPTDEG